MEFFTKYCSFRYAVTLDVTFLKSYKIYLKNKKTKNEIKTIHKTKTKKNGCNHNTAKSWHFEFIRDFYP